VIIISESFSERKFLYSVVLALDGLGISLIIGFLAVFLIEPNSTTTLINTLFLTESIYEFINPVIVFVLAISLYTTAGPGVIIWLLNINPSLFIDVLPGVLVASLVTWTIVGILIGFILKKPQKALYQGLLTINVSLVFTIIMEIVLVINANLIATGFVTPLILGFGIWITIFFSLLMIVYCTFISTVSAMIAKKILPPSI
jgi:hypothetical protein